MKHSSLNNGFAAIFESSQRDAQAIMRGVSVNAPSLDAARVLGDGIRHAESLARAEAQDVAAASKAEQAIQDIKHLDFSAEVAARLVLVLRNRVAAASWAHFKHVAEAIEFLDDAHDTLGAV